jgi:ATP-dependent DNA helicase RecQ
VGAGKERYFNFDINQFVHAFKLDAVQTLNVIKALELGGLISFNESIFLPAKASFTTDKISLNEFETAHPQFETIIKCLLRTYQGIFENRVSVFEKQIARICRMDQSLVTACLQQLQAFGIIEYLPQKETPQLYFLTDRAPAKYLHLDYDFYLKRKKLYTQGIATMQRYIGLRDECRSKFIAYYFGDKSVNDCGICDNCLKKKQTLLSAKEYDEIKRQLLVLLQQEMNIKALLTQLKMFNTQKVWKVINHLQEEGKIETDTFGNLRFS